MNFQMKPEINKTVTVLPMKDSLCAYNESFDCAKNLLSFYLVTSAPNTTDSWNIIGYDGYIGFAPSSESNSKSYPQLLRDKGLINSLSFGVRAKSEFLLRVAITLGEWSDSYLSIDYKQIFPTSPSGAAVLWASELTNMSMNGVSLGGGLFDKKKVFATFEPIQSYSYIYFKDISDY